MERVVPTTPIFRYKVNPYRKIGKISCMYVIFSTLGQFVVFCVSIGSCELFCSFIRYWARLSVGLDVSINFMVYFKVHFVRIKEVLYYSYVQMLCVTLELYFTCRCKSHNSIIFGLCVRNTILYSAEMASCSISYILFFSFT